MFCPRCGEEVAPGQDYCVDCGLRLPGPDAVGYTRDPGRGWLGRSLVGLVAAVVGGAAAVAATGGSGGTDELLTATGGFATTPIGAATEPSANAKRNVAWPQGQDGWTITLASLPQTGGKNAAVERARDARKRKLPTVGILDSSLYASLHPGYWVVFAGVYSSEAEATSALPPARTFTPSASVRRIVP